MSGSAQHQYSPLAEQPIPPKRPNVHTLGLPIDGVWFPVESPAPSLWPFTSRRRTADLVLSLTNDEPVTASSLLSVSNVSSLTSPLRSLYLSTVSELGSDERNPSDKGASYPVYKGYVLIPSQPEDCKSNLGGNHSSAPPNSTQYANKETSEFRAVKVSLAGSSREITIMGFDKGLSLLSLFDGPFDTRSPSVAAKVSPYIASDDDGSLSSGLVAYAPVSHHVYSPSPSDLLLNDLDEENDALHYPLSDVEFIDELRQALESGVAMYDAGLEMLLPVLEQTLREKASIDITTISLSRIDKLVQGVIEYKVKEGDEKDKEAFKDVSHKAALIQRYWLKRFKGRISTIDRERAFQMITHGRLASVILERKDDSAEWKAVKQVPGACTDAVTFQPGQWWLNTACAVRDGIANKLKKSGAGEVTGITLLKGIEIFDPKSGCMIYMLEGNHEEMMHHLMDKVGKFVRILRGYKLKSVCAPEAGIRYDGMYMLRIYSHKTMDTNKGLYRMLLSYKGVDGKSFANDNYLTPSGRDDWDIYKRIEREEMQKWCTPESYNEWLAEEDREARDRQKWQSQEDCHDYGAVIVWPFRLPSHTEEPEYD